MPIAAVWSFITGIVKYRVLIGIKPAGMMASDVRMVPVPVNVKVPIFNQAGGSP